MTIARGEPMLADDILYLAFFPKGTILMFSGSEYTRLINAAGTDYKDVWKLCDGQNGTPDLINKFIRAGVNSGGTGGSDNVTLTTANIPLPAHSHGLTGITIETTGAHSHTVSGSANSEGGHIHTVTGTVDSGGTHSHRIKNMQSDGRHSGSRDNPSWDARDPNISNYTESAGEHSHTFSNGSASGGGHTHSLTGTADSGGVHTHKLTGSTDSFGGSGDSSAAISILPSYYTLVYIMKVI